MRLIAIANISNGKETIGFRLLDTDKRQTKDVPLDNVKSVINEGTIQIDNLKVKEDIVIGSNGSINRLPTIINKQLIGKSPLIIINQLGDIGYIVSDFKGIIKTLENDKVIKYAKKNGIANGKIVNKDGKEYISSIQGEYKLIAASKEKVARVLAKATLLYSKVEKLADGRLLITSKV